MTPGRAQSSRGQSAGKSMPRPSPSHRTLQLHSDDDMTHGKQYIQYQKVFICNIAEGGGDLTGIPFNVQACSAFSHAG